MADFSWKEAYATGIGFIDAQHKTILSDLAAIHTAVERERPKNRVLEGVDTLAEDCARHFSDEDHLMVRYNYPETEAHIRHHDLFIRRIETFRKTYSLDTDKMLRDISEMHDWFTRHILEYDKLYMEHMIT